MLALIEIKKEENERRFFFRKKAIIKAEMKNIAETSALAMFIEVSLLARKVNLKKVFTRLLESGYLSSCDCFCVAGIHKKELSEYLSFIGMSPPRKTALKSLAYRKLVSALYRETKAEKAAFIDLEGRSNSFEIISFAAKKFRYLTIITNNAEKFLPLKEALYENYGAVIGISALMPSAGEYGAVIYMGDDLKILSAQRRRGKAVLAPDIRHIKAFETDKSNVISLDNIVVAEERIGLLPQAYEKFELICYLCEAGAISENEISIDINTLITYNTNIMF